MNEESIEGSTEGHSSKVILTILLLILVGSPGSLLIFARPLEFVPILLLFTIPITLLFVLWYRRILNERINLQR